MTDHQYKYDWD